VSELEQALENLLSGQRRRRAAGRDALLDLAEDSAKAEDVARGAEGLLSHKDATVRGTALLALALARGEAALAALEAHAADSDLEVLTDLAHAAKILGPPGRSLMSRLLTDKSIEVRFPAALGLAELEDKAGIEVLIQALELPRMRYQALAALQSLADTRALEPARRLFKKRFFVNDYERVAAAGVLASLGDAEGKAWLVERIARRKGMDRGLAIELAGELKLREAIPALEATLGDKEDVFRGAAVRALGMMGASAFLPRMVAILSDDTDDSAARMDAAEGLMHLGTPEAKAALEKVASTADLEVREVVLQALDELRKAGA